MSKEKNNSKGEKIKTTQTPTPHTINQLSDTNMSLPHPLAPQSPPPVANVSLRRSKCYAAFVVFLHFHFDWL
jgi:hypothetical protein